MPGSSLQVKMANILVIDDDPSVRRVLVDILSGEGHNVSLASHGEEGASLLKGGEYDLVFTDLGMPGLSGWEIINAVGEHREDVQVVVMTGWPEEIITQALDSDRVQGVLTKPFKMDRLLALIGELMGKGTA